MLKSGECRSTAKRGTWDRAAWMLHEAGSWGSSPVSFAIFPMGCWWKTAGGCFPPFFSSLFSLHTPYHAEPVPVTMVTQGEPSRETEGCKQKRDPLSHFRNLQGGGSPEETDQRYHNSVAFNTVLYLHWKSDFIIHIFFFCACTCESTKVSLHCSPDSKWTSVSLTFMLFFCTCFAPVYFNRLPEKKLINTIKQKRCRYIFSNYLPCMNLVQEQIISANQKE